MTATEKAAAILADADRRAKASAEYRRRVIESRRRRERNMIFEFALSFGFVTSAERTALLHVLQSAWLWGTGIDTRKEETDEI